MAAGFQLAAPDLNERNPNQTHRSSIWMLLPITSKASSEIYFSNPRTGQQVVETRNQPSNQSKE